MHTYSTKIHYNSRLAASLSLTHTAWIHRNNGNKGYFVTHMQSKSSVTRICTRGSSWLSWGYRSKDLGWIKEAMAHRRSCNLQSCSYLFHVSHHSSLCRPSRWPRTRRHFHRRQCHPRIRHRPSSMCTHTHTHTHTHMYVCIYYIYVYTHTLKKVN